ncbi:hypothetical protein [Candidatus Venteria ishoeyi]|uniref:Cytochrome C n=1 Tax=Candidatus Venteria ishoeyi TaxID=1899563 RepID=A0A1H6FFJ4_9GAMM|nr:hypothetical protein [Candidatus Venteria ishoeyi]SEH08797.1 Uncharacterised protein [Candidatus Venteria ishoeyi]
MKQTIYKFLTAIYLISSVSAFAAEDNNPDKRISLGLNATEKVAFLTEMQQMLASIQGILIGMGEDDRQKIMNSARASGNKMARATPESIKQKLPPAFKALGGPTHMLFEELAIYAETDDMDMLAAFSGKLMQQCMNCHAMFKVD